MNSRTALLESMTQFEELITETPFSMEVFQCVMGVIRDVNCLNDLVQSHIQTVVSGESLKRHFFPPHIFQKGFQYALKFELEEQVIDHDRNSFVLF